MSATPFHKILIANRGEIARRIIKSARAAGYRTVAVYSTADKDALHVREADQAVCIGEPLPAQSYLCIDALIAAAKLSGADAVHPGYGFLAENEHFADACHEAGLVFIGPSAEAIRSMGNKAAAKALMQKAGVPCVPGWQGEEPSEARLLEEAQRVGFPLMIKATNGGGGRGMRLVQNAGEFPELLRSARSEAQSAFGSPEVLLEKAIIQPRHIEIQIFADRHGNAIHLGERDCSVQRRHQKVIEEAPSPAVNADLRERMGAVAVKAVKAIRYEGAGTLEFLLDADGNFYFMEMNTRLQVEHPVTEAITGLDLVALQLLVASGQPLPITQQQVQFKGHAIEVRLCAEDAAQGFMPQSGRMALWQVPSNLRVEHALQPGSEIPPYYDSMIAKLITHGATREDARRKLLCGLGDLVALGTTTNQKFLQRCLAHPVFAQGGATTAFIGEHQQELLAAEDDASRTRIAALAAVLLCRGGSGQITHSLPIALRFELLGKAVQARVQQQQRREFAVEIGGQSHLVSVLEEDGARVRLLCDGLSEALFCQREANSLLLHFRGTALRIEDHSHQPALKAGATASDGKLRASMNGRVVALLAAVGDEVKAGQPILTLEAMKMEHVHKAPAAGRLTALFAAEGEQVAARQILAEIESTAAKQGENHD